MPQTNNQMQNVAPSAMPAVVTVNSLLSKDAIKGRFQDVLGKKAPGFISSVISVSNSPSLIGADPKTVVSAAMVAATLDLPVNNNLGFAYIVPYVNKGQKQAQFQMGYKGFIQLAQRSGQYRTINATEVREGELIENDILSGEIKIKALTKDREKANIIGYAAYFELINGFSKTLYMSKEEMEAHAKKYSQSYRNDKYNSSLWATQFDVMAKKTVLKLLLSKFGPMTIDTQMAKAIQYDQSVVKDAENIEDSTFEYVDNEEQEQGPEVQQNNTPGRAEAMEAAAAAFNDSKN